MIESRIGFNDLEQVRTKEEWNDAGMKDEIKKDENEKAQKDENENEKDKNEDELTEILPSPQHQTSLLRGRNR